MTQRKIVVAEVAMEFSLTPEILEDVAQRYGPHAARASAMSCSVGGIGPLLRERVIGQAEADLEVLGIGLLYDAVWVQGRNLWEQLQLLRSEVGDVLRSVLEPLPEPLTIQMYDNRILQATAYRCRYGEASVYLLDCPEITGIVYPGWQDAPSEAPDPHAWAEEQRLRQSWLLGRGSQELMKQLGIHPDVTVLSETPTLFAHHRLVRDTARDPWFQDTKYVFNDHTPLEYAHPVWPVSTLERLRVEPSLYRAKAFLGEGGLPVVDVTELIVDLADAVYGVAEIHGKVMRSMSRLQPHAEKIETITNGVGVDIWQHPDLRNWESVTPEDLLEHKKRERVKLADWLWMRLKLPGSWREGAQQRPILVWTRRVTYYKRLDLLQTIIEREDLRQRFMDLGVTLVVGGRIHQVDQTSRGIVFNLLESSGRHPEVAERILFLDNFNVWEAPHLFHGADGTVMVSNRGREASATGFMKAQLNGALVLATRDGAIPESVTFMEDDPDRANGFEVPYHGEHPTAVGVLTALEGFARAARDPAIMGPMAVRALQQTPVVDVRRTSGEMIQLYQRILAPAGEGAS